MNKTITLVGALCATCLAFACDDDPVGIPPVVVAGTGGSGSGGAPVTGSGGGATTGSGGQATTEGTTDGAGGTVSEGEALLDTTNVSWVPGSANTKGIQGAFFVLEDSMKEGSLVEDGLVHTDLVPDDFADATSLCVTGTVAGVTTLDGMKCDATKGEDTATGCQWSAIWGGGIGLNLNETGEMTGDTEGTTEPTTEGTTEPTTEPTTEGTTEPTTEGTTEPTTEATTETAEATDSVQSPWDAVAAGATGFAFNISGTFDGTMRFKGKMQDSDDDFCAEIEFGDNKVDMTEWVYSCWDMSLATEKSINTSLLWQIQWQLVTKQNTTYSDVEFCVNSLSVY